MDELTDQADAVGTVTRNGSGDFERSIFTAKRDAEAARLRARSMTYQQIGDALGVTKQSAFAMVKRALSDTLKEPADQVRQLELDKLDAMEAAALAIMERQHWAHSNGKLVYMGEEPLVDDGPALAAVNTLLKVQERRSKLLGLDSPTKLAVTGAMRYELVGVDMDEV